MSDEPLIRKSYTLWASMSRAKIRPASGPDDVVFTQAKSVALAQRQDQPVSARDRTEIMQWWLSGAVPVV
jgi:hypothetical protein